MKGKFASHGTEDLEYAVCCDAGFVKEVITHKCTYIFSLWGHVQSVLTLLSVRCPVFVLSSPCWQCFHDNVPMMTLEHTQLVVPALKTHIVLHTHSQHNYSLTHTNTHTLVLHLSGHTLVVTHTLCRESGATWQIIRTDTHMHTQVASLVVPAVALTVSACVTPYQTWIQNDKLKKNTEVTWRVVGAFSSTVVCLKKIRSHHQRYLCSCQH